MTDIVRVRKSLIEILLTCKPHDIVISMLTVQDQAINPPVVQAQRLAHDYLATTSREGKISTLQPVARGCWKLIAVSGENDC